MLNNILEGIKTRDTKVLSYIYEQYYPVVLKLIIKLNGTSDEAKDIFQNVIIDIHERAVNNKLNIHVKFKSYLIGACRNMWYAAYNRKKIYDFEDIDNIDEKYLSEEMLYFVDNSEELAKDRLFYKYFSKLKKECQIILRLFFDKVPMKRIAHYLGYIKTQQAKNQKSECKKILIKNIQNDPLFRKLFIQKSDNYEKHHRKH